MPIRTLFNWLKPPLRQLEKRLISAVSERLSPEVRCIFDQQVGKVNYVQRHAKGKEVNLYLMRHGKPSYEKAVLFPLKTETLLATVEFNVKDRPKKFYAELWIVEGWFFSIQFDQRIDQLQEADLQISDIKVVSNPLKAAGEIKFLSPDEFKAALGEWQREFKLENVLEPPSPTEQTRLLWEIQAELPSDYLELVSQTDGFDVGEWHVYGLSRLRKVATEDQDYYILAEKTAGGALAVAKDSDTPEIYFIDYEDDIVKKTEVSFRAALGERIASRSRPF